MPEQATGRQDGKAPSHPGSSESSDSPLPIWSRFRPSRPSRSSRSSRSSHSQLLHTTSSDGGSGTDTVATQARENLQGNLHAHGHIDAIHVSKVSRATQTYAQSHPHIATMHGSHHHTPTAGEVPVPYGPETGDEHEEFIDPRLLDVDHLDEEGRAILRHLIRPDDSYTQDGTYWADLPFPKRLKFVWDTDKEEAKAELSSIGRMMKKDPLSPVGWYFRNAILPGAGLGLEGYVLFSIGNLEPLFKGTWPECWGKNATACSKNWVAAVTYLEVIGIMVGQIGVGIIGDWMGRRWGLIQDASIMFVGLLMITASWGLDLNGWVICYGWSLFFYGFGVGGEYPITATSSMEDSVRADTLSTRDDRMHRGRKVCFSFMMQGWGMLVNQVMLILLLLVFNSGRGDPPYSVVNTQWTFRVSFALAAVGTLWLVYYRIWKMPNAGRQLRAAKRRTGVTGYDVASLKSTIHHFGGRLLATAGAWFANDVFFYGNKLFQGQFISVLSANPDSVMTGWLWNLANIGVSLAGYYGGALLIDNRIYGRKNMQIVGFMMCFICFVIPAFKYHFYTSGPKIHDFQAMYFISSFFNQFGPNSVTFLVAGEVFPTSVRASAHGFSACVGKAGALLASVLYNYIDTQTKFYVVPWFGLAGALLTWIFLPDTTGLDLKEQERRWEYIRRGDGDKYRGVAIHPNHLSLWERWWGVGKNYDSVEDEKMLVADLRKEWLAHQQAASLKEATGDGAADGASQNLFSSEVHEYFRRKERARPGEQLLSGKGKERIEMSEKEGSSRSTSVAGPGTHNGSGSAGSGTATDER